MSNDVPVQDEPQSTSSEVTVDDGVPTEPEDETRKKFREALDRKHQRQHATAESAAHDGSDKAHGTAAPVKNPQFRRKAI